MKAQMLLPLAIAVSIITVGVMKIRKREHDKDQRKNRFQEIKLRVTYDVLSEYQNEKLAKQQQLETAEKQQKTLEEEIPQLETSAETARANSEDCLSVKKSEQETLDVVDKEFRDIKDSTEKEKSDWLQETASLQKQLDQRSPVCDFLKPDSQSAGILCGIKAEAPKPEGAKAEAPKPEEAKAEAPKAEEAKVEAPKAEEAKAEAPKAEEAKAEAPKAEEVKAEAPKAEEVKAEAAKPEEAKAEAAKPEEAKAEAAKPEEPKAEAPKPDEA